jgi:hypothetical protein
LRKTKKRKKGKKGGKKKRTLISILSDSVPRPGLHPPVAVKVGSMSWQPVGVHVTLEGWHTPFRHVLVSHLLFRSLQILGVLTQLPEQ